MLSTGEALRMQCQEKFSRKRTNEEDKRQRKAALDDQPSTWFSEKCQKTSGEAFLSATQRVSLERQEKLLIRRYDRRENEKSLSTIPSDLLNVSKSTIETQPICTFSNPGFE